MSDTTESFDLAELARAADVTPRTVRYYVQQGLLAPPGTRGPATRYDRGHLDRLLLIRQWQRLHLPLAEVRKRLAGMDDQAVREALEQLPGESATSPVERGRSSDALDYVRSLLHGGKERDVLRAKMPLGAPPPARARGFAAAPSEELSPPGATLYEAPGADGREELKESGRTIATRSTWDRVALTDDIELHVRRPLTRDDNRRVDRLIDFARRLFGEEEGA